jgi:hypothetical protein
MLGSKSKYFFKSKDGLLLNRKDLIKYLTIWKYSKKQIDVYLKAFDYFCENPTKFDGATIVKDLYHIPGLDINAMLHDYQYVLHSCATNLKSKFYCDYLYAKQMEKLGKGQLAWWRFAYLKITGIPFYIYSLIKKGKQIKEQEKEFFNEYKILK